ncbi:hypothetical protein H6P81_016277 [Aristolochia fimbriata]|uniref:DUF2470 domain-containing protein n=1 Tax=Aristolochia fimbriata TaxID=158543 RepID=A0AAV7E7W3_ARIFI|nr:hypothetical protein H6P81_016277 [Aristolochia fimbriata]
MKKSTKAVVLSLAERCKNILSSNWHSQLHTIKADAKGSKGDIHSSRVKYFFKRGKPYIWIPEGDLHNVNTMIDERGSFSVVHTIPGPLMGLLKSIKKLPPRVALTGDVVPLKDDKVKLAWESLRQAIESEREVILHPSYSVSGVLSSSTIGFKSRSENLLEVLEGNDPYVVYKFDIRFCSYIDINGSIHEVDVDNIAVAKTDPLSPFTEKLIDGINQSQARRRALMLFCFVYLNKCARDAFILSVDRKGFDVLAKMPSVTTKDGLSHYEWKDLRFSFKEEADDIEGFCHKLVEMEEDALKNLSSFSGLALQEGVAS